LACAECDDSLLFSGAASIPVCYITFPATLLLLLFFHPPSLLLAIYFLGHFSVFIFPNLNMILFWELCFLPFLYMPKPPWTKPIVFDCTFIGGTSLDVSPACPYPFPSTLLLNVLGQIAAFLGDKKKTIWKVEIATLSISGKARKNKINEKVKKKNIKTAWTISTWCW
jgi:hypothetical protein